MTALSPLRVGRITGSRVAAVLGISPYQTRDGVLREMVRQFHGAPDEFNGNIATQWGERNEPEAIARYEQMTGLLVHGSQEIVIHPEHDWLAVTPDGLVGDDGLLEVKCPYAAVYTHVSERPDYAAQLQLQLAVTGREWADFFVWRPDGVSVEQVARDPAWLDLVLPALREFMAEYHAVVDDPERAAEHLTDRVGERSDDEWVRAAMAFLDADAELRAAEATKDEARAVLLALAGENNARGAGVSVTHAQRKGSIDYAKAAKDLLTGYDLEQYRKPGSVVVTVRQAA